MLENQDLEPRTTELMVPAEGGGSQHRHQPTAVILATLRISLGWTLVNAQFWSTHWSTRTMSYWSCWLSVEYEFPLSIGKVMGVDVFIPTYE